MRFDAPLFFANGAIFDDWVRSRVEAAGPGVHAVILAAEPITDIDTTAIDELVELDDYLAAHGIRLIFAEMKDPVVDVLRRYGLTERFTPDRFASTVGAAVDELTGTLRGDLEGTKWDDDARASRLTRLTADRDVDPRAQRRVARVALGERCELARCRPRARRRRCGRRAGRARFWSRSSLRLHWIATVIARIRVGISPIDHATPPPMYWSSSGVGPQVRPIAPNHSATMRPDCVMIAMPKNACIAMMPISRTQPAGVGQAVGHRVDADERQHEQVAGEEEVRRHPLVPQVVVQRPPEEVGEVEDPERPDEQPGRHERVREHAGDR